MPTDDCILKKDLRSPELSPLDDLETLHKQEVKGKSELLIAWLNIEDMT